MKSREEQLFTLAREVLPGGVCASTRLNRALGHPFYVSRGEGAKIYDLKGREYVDLCISHGASILGHRHPSILDALAKAAELGIVCSYETEYHSALAGKIRELVPCAEMVRFAGSGTETIMHTLRLAREFTGREKIIKFEGHFHGYCDYVQYSSSPPLSAAGPVNTPVPYPQSGGIPRSNAELIIVVPFNDIEALRAAIHEHAHETAALIMEPVNYDAGCVIPSKEYLQQVQQLSEENGVLLIFDEVLTACRMAPGGAQQYYGVTPDLAILGKAIGGGMPISAFCGKRSIMEHLRPLGNSEHSGTYMAPLMAVLGALACLEELSQPGVYERMWSIADRLYRGIDEIIRRRRVRARLQHLGARFTIYFGLDPDEEVMNYRAAARQDVAMTLRFVAAAVANGVYFHDYGGKPAHHGFSLVHTSADIDRALEGIDAACAAITA